MTREDIRHAIIEALGDIAPETNPAATDPQADLRDALDIDSMDFLNVVIALHKRLQVDIPEADYPRLFTMAGATDYLAGKLGI